MRSSLIVLSNLSLLGLALARPIIQDAQFLLRLDAGETRTQCFTQRAAQASDCQTLLSSPPPPDWTNVAAAGSAPVFKPFCNASCCLFTDTKGVLTDDLVSAGATLLGCEQLGKGLVNGVTKSGTAGFFCLADAMGAEGCFDNF
ncbi:hypothetical protein B0H15DRAFT_31430 [Mycena belliarum]|uniref:Uncharacterized protein n=1 Tax=Mycena belliarum TaxID=1033014 RepID=A0AAD6UHA3_9AGAR|nr:hypothetical protein B0H15DRAFT_31430 [Mycena belliae]